MSSSQKKALILGSLLVLALSIPITVRFLQPRQEIRSKAAGSTKLSFTPVSTATAPLQKNVGDTIALDMMVDPGTNLVTFIRFQLQYDPTKLEIVQPDPFTINASAFPQKIEGPVLGSGTVAESLSVGSDPTKAIQAVTKVGTVNFKAIAGTGGAPTTVTYTTLTQALSSGANDQAGENVLSTTTPATIIIEGGTAATPSGTVTPEPTSVTTSISLDLLLHGVGAAGDNPNPKGNDLSNKNPLHPQRDVDVIIIDNTNQVIATQAGAILYDNGNGSFTGKIDLGTSFPTGNYNIKVKTDRYLRKLVPGIQTITNLKDNKIPQIDVVAGDINDDNILNVLDYNAFLDCGYGEINPIPMIDPNSTFNKQPCQVHKPVINVDVDDNGVVDSPDYNLFLRELSVQNGD